MGKAPLQVSIKKGRHVVVAVRGGYKRWARAVVLKGETVSVNAVLKKK